MSANATTSKSSPGIDPVVQPVLRIRGPRQGMILLPALVRDRYAIEIFEAATGGALTSFAEAIAMVARRGKSIRLYNIKPQVRLMRVVVNR